MPKMSVSSLKDVKKDEIIVVGKLQLIPHIRKDEIIYQNTTFLPENIHKQIGLITSDKFYDVETNNVSYYKDVVVTTDGGYFYFTWKRNKPLHILGTTFKTRMTQANQDRMFLIIKKGLKVKHSKKAQAVYVGNITFHRDEFFNIKKIDINQKGMKKAQRIFRKKFRTKWRLKKAKLSSSR